MKIRGSKKGVTHTTFDIVVGIVGGIGLFVIFYFAISAGLINVEREIRTQTFDIKSEEAFTAYLSNIVSKGPQYGWIIGGEPYSTAKTLAESERTISELIVMIGNDGSENYRKILQEQTEHTLDSVFGKERWKLDIEYPDGNTISYREVEGETKVYEQKLPSPGHQLVNMKLTLEKETLT